MSKLRCVPNDEFIGAILLGYRAEKASHADKPVTCAQVWDRVCGQCMTMTLSGFRKMFEWDVNYSAVKHYGIGTIRDMIVAGHVPGLHVTGRFVVEEVYHG